jgi:hypothetical protein
MTYKTLTKLVVNCETGETIELPLTAEEIADREAMAEQIEAQRIAAESESTRLDALKASAKAKLVAGQPLTADEADTLVL